MKQIYLIGGTMGVGKTIICQKLKAKLDNSVFLDGDWCWDMNPFIVNKETKEMVLQNITCVLNNFINCSVYSNIILGWVMDEQEIINELIDRLNTGECIIHKISLVCTHAVLMKHLEKDIESGIRKSDMVDRAIEKLPKYHHLDTQKIDITELTPDAAVLHIIENC